MYVFSTSQRRVSVELVGKNKVEEKLKKFDELLSISVSFMGVSSVEPLCQISTLLPSNPSAPPPPLSLISPKYNYSALNFVFTLT
jgi:hypothetical protein